MSTQHASAESAASARETTEGTVYTVTGGDWDEVVQSAARADDERIVVDGPFAETKEVIAGFSIIKASSLQEAIDVVKRAPNVFPNGKAEVEIRQLMDVEDFGEGFTPNEEIAKVKFQ